MNRKKKKKTERKDSMKRNIQTEKGFKTGVVIGSCNYGVPKQQLEAKATVINSELLPGAVSTESQSISQNWSYCRELCYPEPRAKSTECQCIEWSRSCYLDLGPQSCKIRTGAGNDLQNRRLEQLSCNILNGAGVLRSLSWKLENKQK